MTIYVDIVLLENLCMNYIILFSTSYILKIKIKHFRIILSSMLGAVYAILAYTDIIPIYTSIISKIILSICMIYIAYKPKNVKGMLKELIVFYLVSFALGGSAFALLYIVRPQDIFMKDGVYIGIYPLKIALLGGITGFVITYSAFKVVKSRITKNEIIYTALVNIFNKELQTKVLLDTGNMLKDPISGEAVILIEKDKLCEIIPKSILESMAEILGGEKENYDKRENDDIECEDEVIEIEEKNMYRTRLRIIPFTSVGKQNGMMIGIKSDFVKIITDVDEIINDNVIVCLYEKKFSKLGKYYGLIGLDILEGSEKRNEFFANIKE